MPVGQELSRPDRRAKLVDLARLRRPADVVVVPPYAPDLNPVEAMWGWLKYGRLANFVPADVNVLDNWVIEHLVELKHTPELLRSLWAGSDLPFPISPAGPGPSQ